MKTHIVTATEFRARCLAILGEVEQQGGPVTITRRGVPVAVLGPVKKKAFRSSKNALAGKGQIVGDIVNFDTSHLWEALRKE
jgi:prevent-host-death family protein